MAFAFSLSTVLALRRQREQVAERTLTATLAELAAARTNLQRIDAEMRTVAEERARLGPESLRASVLNERYARANVLEQGRAEMLACLAELEARREQQQVVYLAARRDRELLEDLERRQRSVFLAEAERREAKRLDDLFLSRRRSQV